MYIHSANNYREKRREGLHYIDVQLSEHVWNGNESWWNGNESWWNGNMLVTHLGIYVDDEFDSSRAVVYQHVILVTSDLHQVTKSLPKQPERGNFTLGSREFSRLTQWGGREGGREEGGERIRRGGHHMHITRTSPKPRPPPNEPHPLTYCCPVRPAS